MVTWPKPGDGHVYVARAGSDGGQCLSCGQPSHWALPAGDRVYIAGPMTGLPEFNYPAFNAAERLLSERGYDAVSPARPYAVEPTSYKGYMVRGLGDVASCDGVALLSGWQHSRGALLELHVAFELRLKVRNLDYWLEEGASAVA